MQEKIQPPLISLCLVTQDNATHLPLTLSSAHGFVDQIVVVDLGSTDGTQRIAREFDAEVVDLSAEDKLSRARKVALKHALGKWILQLDPGHELVVDSVRPVREELGADNLAGYFVAEYSLDNPIDYYYKPLLYRNLPDLTFNEVFDESPLLASDVGEGLPEGKANLGLLRTVHLFHRVRELKIERARQNIGGIERALEEDPRNIGLYFYLAFFQRQLGQDDEFQAAVQKGIQIMTQVSAEVMLNTRESTGLFGYFAESLACQNVTVAKTIDSLVQLQRNLPSDIRLNTHLAALLHELGRTEEALNLLQEAIHLSFKPRWATLTFFESFVEPVYQLLEIIRQTRDEEDLLKIVLNIQALSSDHGFSMGPVFCFLNEHHPDFLNMIDGILKRKLKEMQ